MKSGWRRKPQSDPRAQAVPVLVLAAWFFAFAFAIVQAPALGMVLERGVVSYSALSMVVAGVAGTCLALLWGAGKLSIGPVGALLLNTLIAWGLTLGLLAFVPKQMFAILDAALPKPSPGLGGLVIGLLAQLALVAILLYGTGFMRRLERLGSTQSAEDAVAQRLHEAMVPNVDRRCGAIAVWGSSRPCQATGGDFIEVYEDSRGSLTVVVGDVSGHGVGAGILMAMLKGAMRVRLQQDVALDQLLRELNELVISLDRPGVFVTATAVRVHADGRFESSSAGHLPILRFDPTSPRYRDIPNECLPLGVLSEEQYLVHRCHLGAGETLALLTDGLVEVQDRGGKQIGMPIVRKVLQSRMHAALPDLFSALAQRCEAFGTQTDDQTLVLIRFGERPSTLEPLPTDLDEEWDPSQPVAQPRATQG